MARAISRRTTLTALAGALALDAKALQAAPASKYPTGPVRFLVGFAAGGAADITARVIGQWLSDRLGQTFVVENRTGAGSNIAAEELVRSDPDGQTLLCCAASNAINASLYQNLRFDFIRDTIAVAGLLNVPDVLLINPALPVKSVQEFIDYAKANAGKVNFASAGVGSSQHLAGELFKLKTGIDMVHVAYRGGAPAAAAVLSGEVQVYFGTLSTALTAISSGLRALGITTRERSPSLPDVPPISDTVPGYEVNSWFGISAPRATPKCIVDLLSTTVNEGLADPAIQKRLSDLGGVPMPMKADDFGAFIETDTKRWAEVVHAMHLSVK